jgi:hypothetical protein
MASLDYALDLWHRGLSVVPVPRPRFGVEPGRPGDGKVPTISWREFQHRRPTETEIRTWFRTDQNIAVITGAVSGVIVVDADSSEGIRWATAHLPYTPWQTKTCRGFHLWYRHPGVVVCNRARLETPNGRLAIDVRGDGGYVIAPGSIHATGSVYEAAGNWMVSRERLPAFWVGWLQRPQRVAFVPASARRPIGAVVARARTYLARIPRPEIGYGSDVATLSAACRVVRGFGLTEADAVELLWEWAGGRDGWTRAWIQKKVRNAAAYGTEPMGALR